jgi:hypothetical protein
MKHLIRNTPSRTKKLKKIILNQLSGISEISKTISFDIDLDKFTKDVKEPDIKLTTNAYSKIMTLVKGTDKEIAWHGTVDRYRNTFIIDDILIYPQTATSATVESDDKEYPSWLYNLPDGVFDRIKMQGHSHVNMGVTPSGTDTQFYADQVTQVSDYRIFMIVNKSAKFNIIMYDMEQGVLFTDLEFEILGDENLSDWLKNELKKVKSFKPARVASAHDRFHNYYNQDWRKVK